MKIAAIIEEFPSCTQAHTEFIAQVRAQSRADLLIAIMSGDFLQQGLPAGSDKYTRAGQAVRAGVDIVIELPVYCALSSPDTYAYACISTIESMHCVDEIYLACNTDRPQLLMEIAKFLFLETREYQLKVKKYRQSGLSFYEAQAKAVGDFIPGAKELLSDPVNIFAAEYLRAQKRIYSMVKPRLVQAPGLSPLSVTETPAAAGQTLSALLGRELTSGRCRPDEIFGGTSMLSLQMAEAIPAYTDFLSFASRLQSPTRSQANIRRYLLSLMLGIRKADMSICWLYGFALYYRILDSRDARTADAFLAVLQTHTHTPGFLCTGNTETDTAPEEADSLIHMMADIDRRAHQLYQQI